MRPKGLKALQQTLTRELTYGVLPSGSRDHVPERSSNGKLSYSNTLREETLDAQHLPWSWGRAAILIRINSFLKACSAVRPGLVKRLQELLVHDLIPMIPLRGSISASGDLSPLAYISGVVQGKSTVRVLTKDGGDLYADRALERASLEPYTLEPKEGLSLVNGTAISAAAGALAIYDANILAVLAQLLTAMSVEALTGTDESFHPFLANRRSHPGQSESARNILAFLKGSELVLKNDGPMDHYDKTDTLSAQLPNGSALRSRISD